MYPKYKIYIFPSCLAIVKVVLGEAAEAEIKKIPLSLRRGINEMSDNIEENVALKMKEANMYALQVDESTDIKLIIVLEEKLINY